jgi:hypothetical protein
VVSALVAFKIVEMMHISTLANVLVEIWRRSNNKRIQRTIENKIRQATSQEVKEVVLKLVRLGH